MPSSLSLWSMRWEWQGTKKQNLDSVTSGDDNIKTSQRDQDPGSNNESKSINFLTKHSQTSLFKTVSELLLYVFQIPNWNHSNKVIRNSKAIWHLTRDIPIPYNKC